MDLDPEFCGPYTSVYIQIVFYIRKKDGVHKKRYIFLCHADCSQHFHTLKTPDKAWRDITVHYFYLTLSSFDFFKSCEFQRQPRDKRRKKNWYKRKKEISILDVNLCIARLDKISWTYFICVERNPPSGSHSGPH